LQPTIIKMNKIIDVIHFYRVESLDKTKAFYESILGFKLVKDQGKCLIYDTQGFGSIGFCLHFPTEGQNNTCITLVCQDKTGVDAMYHHIQKHIKSIEKPSINDYFQIYHFFLKDYNDLTIEVQCFL
jgi:catechol 2,3-dioxygenase-like lactoylglutathione lyase family enzyme